MWLHDPSLPQVQSTCHHGQWCTEVVATDPVCPSFPPASRNDRSASQLLGFVQHNPVPHCWGEPGHLKRRFCNVCRKRIEDSCAVRCEVCDYSVHVECQDFGVADCKECATYVPSRDPIGRLVSSIKNEIVVKHIPENANAGLQILIPISHSNQRASYNVDTYADSSLAGRQLTPKLEVPIMQEDLLVCGVLGRDAMRMVQYHSES
ncbi:diacylglycerol kinase [Trichonephila clavipes]|nr:diacylglycerol kinase [Trichonephila clavipes]